MEKELSEMTLEELWRLFPIFLVKPQSHWKAWFEEESRILRAILGPDAQIHHIGSTALETIWAKPIIDILVEIPGDLEAAKESLERNGYLCMSSGKDRISLNKGYTKRGFAEKVFHIHLRRPGDNDELYFRDYLRQNPQAAKEYEALKLSLWPKFEHDRDGYTEAKGAFIQKCTAVAVGRKVLGTRG